jgi:glycosyltransferase involved in cell wall biosynthesis
MPRFSIITPVHLWSPDRVEMFLKCIDSVKNQTFKDFEWIVVDDGSTVDFMWDTTKLCGRPVKIFHKDHEERVIAYNKAFKEATGEWFVLLDSDDELAPEALEKIDEMIKGDSRFKMFNFGCAYQHKDGKVSYRGPFEPEKKRRGHEVFGGGNIVNGTFVFHRSVYEKLGAYPGNETGHVLNANTTPINYGGKRDLFMGSPYDFSAAAQLEFPQLREQFMVNHEAEPAKIIKELGNPWGQDFYLFYKYTRKYHSKAVEGYLYIVNPR